MHEIRNRRDRASTALLAPLSRQQVAHYLGVLGVVPAAPSRAALDTLVRAQVTRVPFENVSKLHYLHTLDLTGIPPIELYLDGIERLHFGGTCYANNFHFCRLLQALGYDASLCGADMPSGEDVHAAIAVRVESRQLLIDVGYAAPFLQPLPRDSERDVVVAFGRDRYVLSPRDEQGRSRLSLYRDGERIHGYLFKPAPRSIEHFDSVVRDSFRSSATFMNAVMLVRYYDRSSVTVYNLSVIRSTPDGFNVEQLDDRGKLVEAIQREFEMPSSVVRDALATVGSLHDAYR